jgi:hypothetical protein
MAETDYRLEAEVGELRLRLVPIRKLLKPAAARPVLLSYDGAELTIAAPGVSVTVPADGRWPTPVRMRGNLLLLLAEAPGEDESPIVFSFDGQRLRIGGWASFTAEATGEECPPVNLLPPSKLKEALRLTLRHSDEDLRASGMQHILAERDKRLAKAAELLAPLGIEEADLQALQDAKRHQAKARLDRGEPAP